MCIRLLKSTVSRSSCTSIRKEPCSTWRSTEQEMQFLLKHTSPHLLSSVGFLEMQTKETWMHLKGPVIHIHVSTERLHHGSRPRNASWIHWGESSNHKTVERHPAGFSMSGTVALSDGRGPLLPPNTWPAFMAVTQNWCPVDSGQTQHPQQFWVPNQITNVHAMCTCN